MKFGKQLENESEDIPSEWRPYLIQYKALKKLIAKVAIEIEKRGLSATFLREALLNDTAGNDGPRIRYYFAGEPPNVHPCIQFTYDPDQSRVDDLLARVVAKNTPEESSELPEKPKLHYRRTENDTDFFTLIQNADTNPPTDDHDTPSDTESVHSNDPDTSSTKRRKSDAQLFFRELMDTTLSSNRISELTTDGEIELVSAKPCQKKQLRSIVIELERDDEFFAALMKELDEAAMLQDINSQQFEHDVNELERRMAKVASPSHVSDMYTWRAIFNLYMDAQIFRGKVETDRSIRSVKKSKEQMEWFTTQLKDQNILSKLKNKASKDSFGQFIALNTELITMKHYQLLNQTAVTKILKKHDKRSGLTASTSFPNYLQDSHFFSIKLADVLCASLLSRLMTIIPQPDDYSCPVCMMVAWRPIRLKCGHVFCVRCLIKAQRKKMENCPICRQKDAVKYASAYNLDQPMQNFLKQYFPREIKQKKRENEHEQALEDIQAMTGRKYTEEQLMRMSQKHSQCQIM